MTTQGLAASHTQPTEERVALRPRGLALTALHPLVVLASFYSLALHLHLRLGGWPTQLGEEGFPSTLVLHTSVAQLAFVSLLLGLFVLFPLAGLAAVFLPGARRALSYAVPYALLSAAVLLAMNLAPEPFLYWWWD